MALITNLLKRYCKSLKMWYTNIMNPTEREDEYTMRTKEETIKYFKQLAFEFSKEAHRNNDSIAQGKSEAYEMAAFELEKNME